MPRDCNMPVRSTECLCVNARRVSMKMLKGSKEKADASNLRATPDVASLCERVDGWTRGGTRRNPHLCKQTQKEVTPTRNETKPRRRSTTDATRKPSSPTSDGPQRRRERKPCEVDEVAIEKGNVLAAIYTDDRTYAHCSHKSRLRTRTHVRTYLTGDERRRASVRFDVSLANDAFDVYKRTRVRARPNGNWKHERDRSTSYRT